MKNITKVTLTVLLSLLIVACVHNDSAKAISRKSNYTSDASSPIYVYYFHTNIRCETCVQVDNNTHRYLKELFPKELKVGNLVFKSINIENKDYQALVAKYKIWGQTLIFVKGDSAIDRTNDAFMNVSSDSSKWRSMVYKQVESLLKE